MYVGVVALRVFWRRRASVVVVVLRVLLVLSCVRVAVVVPIARLVFSYGGVELWRVGRWTRCTR